MMQTAPAPARTTTRAAVVDRFGGPDVVRLADIPLPVPGAGEVLVRVRAFDVSIGDHRIRARDLPRGFGFVAPFMIGFSRPRHRVLGDSAAGVVEAVGPEVAEWKPGDEVVIQTGMNGLGCHARHVVAKGAAIARKPAALSFEDAAALPFGGYTALSFLDRVALGPAVEVLVNGATGAVGSLMIQLAARAGARVTAVCSGSGAELARSLGAAHVIDYTTDDFAAGPERYDVVVDCVGNAGFARSRAVLGSGGALLLVVADVPGILGARRASKRLGGLVTAFGASLPGRQALQQLLDLAERGEIRAVVDSIFDFDDIVEAHRRVDTGRKRGNVIVRVP